MSSVYGLTTFKYLPTIVISYWEEVGDKLVVVLVYHAPNHRLGHDGVLVRLLNALRSGIRVENDLKEKIK